MRTGLLRKPWHLWMPRWLMFVIIAAVVAIAAVFIYPYFKEVSPTQRIERVLDRAAAAGEAKSIIRLGEVLAMNYVDASGADRAMFLGRAKNFFDETSDLTVRIARVIHEKPDIAPDAVEARAIVIVEIRGKHAGEAFSGIGRSGADAFLVGFRKRDGAWKIITSKYMSGKTPQELLKETGW